VYDAEEEGQWVEGRAGAGAGADADELIPLTPSPGPRSKSFGRAWTAVKSYGSA
jgi:hypothetical protein